ncbi:hypothetical protein C5E16_09225 [Clavibacter michiganensis]|uniref:Uncharacterized protein n=1 Tax=Clavibacter michiganensis TaxID=28447 RepID=A0A2S5VT65_9MICO|nr:hypothetical protein [Clavibacter michiganensis]PPF67370.1 hypothetical protein C5E16_09225 [Clavibacter michiganensis]
MTTRHDASDASGEPDAGIDRLLRAADPAPHLAPLSPGQRAELEEHAMDETTRTPARRGAPSGGGSDRRRPRPTRRPLVLGAVLAAVALVVVVVVLPRGDGDGTRLTVDASGGLADSCAVITPEGLAAAATLAFRGTVESVEGGTATIRVERVYAGEPSETVAVSQGDPDDVVDGAAPVFADGATYLVAASDGRVASCGLTGVDGPELSALYDQAFPG